MEQRFYDLVARELQDGVLQPGLWARAYTETNGDERRAKATYIRLRVNELQIIDRERSVTEETERKQREKDEAFQKQKKEAEELGLTVENEVEIWPMVVLVFLLISVVLILFFTNAK